MNVKQYCYYGKQYGGSTKKLKIELPYGQIIILLFFYPKELKVGPLRNICTPIFITLFTRFEMCKQPKCPVKEDCVKIGGI